MVDPVTPQEAVEVAIQRAAPALVDTPDLEVPAEEAVPVVDHKDPLILHMVRTRSPEQRTRTIRCLQLDLLVRDVPALDQGVLQGAVIRQDHLLDRIARDPPYRVLAIQLDQ